MTTSNHDITRLLQAWSAGDPAAGDALMPRMYEALRAVAARAFRRRGHGNTLQPTALVHEAYLRLVEQHAPWRNRGHFLALAATMMRRILIDRARRAGRLKHGGDAPSVSMTRAAEQPDRDASPEELAAIDEAIADLGAIDERKAIVVTLHLFVGLSVAETANAIDVSSATVTRDWRFARAWLANRLRGTVSGDRSA